MYIPSSASMTTMVGFAETVAVSSLTSSRSVAPTGGERRVSVPKK